MVVRTFIEQNSISASIEASPLEPGAAKVHCLKNSATKASSIGINESYQLESDDIIVLYTTELNCLGEDLTRVLLSLSLPDAGTAIGFRVYFCRYSCMFRDKGETFHTR